MRIFIYKYYISGSFKFLIILYLVTYFDFETSVCYRMKAQFLIDNSFNMSYENLNFSKANQVKDYHHSNLSFFSNTNDYYLYFWNNGCYEKDVHLLKKSENGAKTYFRNCSNYPKCLDSEIIGGLYFLSISQK